MAADGRLDKYGDFALIDMIARNYTYTHNQVAELSWREVMNITALSRERAYVEAKTYEIKRSSEEK